MLAAGDTIIATINGKRIELSGEQAKEALLWFVQQLVTEDDCHNAVVSLLTLSEQVAALRGSLQQPHQDEQDREREHATYTSAEGLHAALVGFLTAIGTELAGSTDAGEPS